MIEYRFALPDERTEVAAFMQTSFSKAKWGADVWADLLDSRWAEPDQPYAVIARDGDLLVGVLGLVCTLRQTKTGPHATANMTSWYVAKTHRGLGVGTGILKFLESHQHLALTNFASAKNAIAVLQRAGFKVLDDTRFNWRHGAASDQIVLHTDPLGLTTLSVLDRKVITDHAGLNLRAFTAETPDGLCTTLISIKQKHDAYVTYEVMYLSGRAAFSKHASAIASVILPGPDTILSVDQRFVTSDATPHEVETIAVPRFVRGGTIRPQDIDHVYSEIVLSDQKMS